MSETAEQTVQKPLSAFITYADSAPGRSLVRALTARGWKVTGATPNGTAGAVAIREDGAIPTYTDLQREGDVRSALLLSRADVVIDLSSTLVNQLPFARPTADTARLDVVPLLNACHALGVGKLIYVSFVGVYGETGEALADENTDVSRATDVQKALVRAESVLLHSDFNVYVLRAGYLYGQHSPAIDRLVAALKGGRAVPRGRGVVSFVHVDDLRDAVLKVIDAENLPNRLYNVVDDAPVSFDAFAAALGTALGVGAPLQLPFTLGVSAAQEALLAQNTRATNARARAELGWQPAYPTQAAGIERMLLLWRAEEAPALPAPAQETALVKA
jgi:nucleoside-diphosphate-sugar epimerase